MEGNYGLCGTLEMMNDHLQQIDLDLSLPLIQGTRMLSQRHILATWKKDC